MAGTEPLARPLTQDAPVDAVDRAAAAPATQGAADDAAGCGSHLPIRDAVAFDGVAAILPADAILTYLRTLGARGTTLLEELREQSRPADAISTIEVGKPFPRPEILVRQAHKLAGSAGMLGFQRLAFVASRFEQALEQASADGAALGERLDVVIEESLVEMRRRTRTHGS